MFTDRQLSDQPSDQTNLVIDEESVMFLHRMVAQRSNDGILPDCLSNSLMKPTTATIRQLQKRCKEMTKFAKDRERERWDRLMEEHEQSTSFEMTAATSTATAAVFDRTVELKIKDKAKKKRKCKKSRKGFLEEETVWRRRRESGSHSSESTSLASVSTCPSAFGNEEERTFGMRSLARALPFIYGIDQNESEDGSVDEYDSGSDGIVETDGDTGASDIDNDSDNVNDAVGITNEEDVTSIDRSYLHPLHYASHVGGFIKMIEGYLFRIGREIVVEHPETQDRYIGTHNVRGQYHGDGEVWYKHSGSYYRGQFQNGRRHGYGTMVLRDDKFYEGYFDNDQRSGEGTFYWGDGRIYKGQYKNDEKCGRGLHVWSTTSSFYGNFFNNLRSGFGIYRWHTGKIFFGFYKSDRRHGRGITFFTDIPERNGGDEHRTEKWILGQYAYGKPSGEFFCVMQDQMPYLVTYDDQGHVEETTLWCMPRK